MSTELFLVLRCEAFVSDIHCENSITTSLSNPARARRWAHQAEGWTTREWVVKRRFRRYTAIRDLCPDHAHLRSTDLS